MQTLSWSAAHGGLAPEHHSEQPPRQQEEASMQSNTVMDQHRKVLGVLYLVFGALWAIGALVLLGLFVGGVIHPDDAEERLAFRTMGVALVMLLAVLAAIGISGGVGMLKRRAWAKVPVLIAGLASLFHFPIGTILGIYTLWFWFQPNVTQLFLPRGAEPRGPEPGGPGLHRPLVT
jgi:hypothetical protein